MIPLSSVDDLNSTLHSSIENYSIKDFEEAIKREEAGQNRKTIIKILQRGLKAKTAGKKKL